MIALIKVNAFDKIQDPLMIKTLNKLRRKMKFSNLIKGTYEKPKANITFSG